MLFKLFSHPDHSPVLQPCHPEAAPGLCLALMSAAAWCKGKRRCSSNCVLRLSPRRARRKKLEGETRDWQMTPCTRIHVSEGELISLIHVLLLLGGELEAMAKQKTKNMGFLQREKEAPVGEME